MEEAIVFEAQGFVLEGLLNKQSGSAAVVITHPHPLFGGDMHNAVVDAIARVYRLLGYTTLKFNFRGTGHSQGRFEDGVGEQHDVLAALDYLKTYGFSNAELAGYSFGAWVYALTVSQGLRPTRMVMVSPPVAVIDFSNVQSLPVPTVVITGSRDDIAPPERIREPLAGWQPSSILEIIRGADHFYSGCFSDLERSLESLLQSVATD